MMGFGVTNPMLNPKEMQVSSSLLSPSNFIVRVKEPCKINNMPG